MKVGAAAAWKGWGGQWRRELGREATGESEQRSDLRSFVLKG